MKRMEWVKLYHNKIYSRKMTAAALLCGVRPACAIALYAALLVYASENNPRGSLDGVDIEEFDAVLFYGDGTAAKLFAQFKARGIITVDNCIENWNEEQDKPAVVSSNAERCRRYRESKKTEQNDTSATSSDISATCSDTTATCTDMQATCSDTTATCTDMSATCTDMSQTCRDMQEEELDKELDLDLDKDLDLEKDLKGLKTHMSDGVGQAPEKAPKVKPIKYSEDFERFWQAYPVERREQKAAAFKGWKLWLKRGATAEQMITAAQNYGRIEHERGTERRFIKMASTFLGPSAAWQDYADGGSQLTADAINGRHEVTYEELEERQRRLYGEAYDDYIDTEATDAQQPESYSLRQEDVFTLSGPR